MIKISIILPVYNVGFYIERCLCSLRCQTLEDIEMIFVDDCSTDGSIDKVNKAAEEDPRIKILRNDTNIGPGASRNRGIGIAQGEYLSFVDPDDYISNVFFEKLYNASNSGKIDIVKGVQEYVREDGTIRKSIFCLNKQIDSQHKTGSPLYSLFRYQHQSAIYKRELINKYDVCYGTSRRGEDSTFLLNICCRTESIVICDQAIYYYCERSDSELHKFSNEALEEQTKAIKDMFMLLENMDKNDSHTLKYINLRIDYYLRILAFCSTVPALSDSSRTHLNTIKQIIEKSPYAEDLSQKWIVIRGLLEYGENLSYVPYKTIWEEKSRIEPTEPVKRWVEFIRFNSDCSLDYRRGLRQAFITASENSLKDKKGRRKLKKLQKLLPKEWRSSVKVCKCPNISEERIKALSSRLPHKIYDKLYQWYKG